MADEDTEDYEVIDDIVQDPDYEPDYEADDEPEDEIDNTEKGSRQSCSNKIQSKIYLPHQNSDNNEIEKCKNLEMEILPNELGKYKLNGDLRKGNKKKDFCFFCETLVLNFSRHVQRNHSFEVDVQRIFSFTPKSKERKELLDALRKKGNFLNSNNICKPVQKLRSHGKSIPCTNCLGLYSSKLLWRHRIKCMGEKNKTHQADAQNLLIAGLRTDLQLRETVFPKMRPDEISFVAKKDPLICAYGTRYMKIHREKHFINVTSRKMRELARLLIEIKKHKPSVTCLLDALKPTMFDLLVEATKAVAKYNVEKDIFLSPTYAINMGTSLKQCAQLAIVFALKRKHIAETVSSANAEADLKTLIKIIESQWQYEISTQAANDLNINKWNKITLVPLASDIRLLKEYLMNQANLAVEALKVNKTDTASYIILLETIFCRVLLLNRRRPGELQRLSLAIYNKVLDREESNYEEFTEVITPSEKILLKTFKRIVIRGKRGRGVPVLFSTDIQEHIQILLSCRQNFIDKGNVYLFGKPNSFLPLCGYKVSTTKLRKHLATLTQVFSMSDNDLEQLAHFMGHTVGVHKGSYRLPDDIYQTAKISKLLLLMERGEAGQYKGKSLNEINLNLDDDLLEEGTADDSDDEQVPLSPSIDVTTTDEINNNSSGDCPSKIAKKRTPVPWTDGQKKVVTKFFSDHIRNKKPPKKNECLTLKEKYPELLCNKDWLKIKVYIQNIYTKVQKK